MHPYLLFVEWAKATTQTVCADVYGQVLPEAYRLKDMSANLPAVYEVDLAIYESWRGLLLVRLH